MKINKTGKIAITEIVILLIAIFAFAWMVGDSAKLVSASDDCTKPNDLACKAEGGVCQDPSTCTGTVKPCLCPGGNDNKCCVPNEQTTENNDGNAGEIINNAADLAVIADTAKELIDKNAGTVPTPVGSGGVVQKTGNNNMWESFMGGEETTPGFFSKLWKTSVGKGSIGTLASGALWGAATAGLITYVSSLFASERNLNDITIVAWAGAGVGFAAVVVLAVFFTSNPVGWIAGAVAALFYGVYMLVGYQIYSRETFTFYPRAWQPVLGGDKCGLCNDLKYPNGENMCSEYICHSYGQACAWINGENETYESCIEINPGDNNAPDISPLKVAYGQNIFPDETNYDYLISDAGAKIIYNGEGGECVPAFTQITLAVGTNEEAYCKIGLESNTGSDIENIFENKMDDMNEGKINTKEHTLALPSSVSASESALAAAGYSINNNGNFEFYIRCRDVQGNINDMDYIMSFCVQDGPDTWAPEVTGTLPAQDSYIKQGTLTIEDFQVYTNEPVDCKWDFERKSYNAMSYNFSTCSQSINDPIRGYRIGCEGNLTGFKDGVVNKYYISCLDQPELKGTNKSNQRNGMDAYELNLIGTTDLVIDEITINGEENGTTIKDSRNTINVMLEVTTVGGAQDGRARCKYSEDGVHYALFSNQGSREFLPINTHNLYLNNGSYGYYIQCEDIAKNTDTTFITFSIETDITPPEIVRVYREDGYLKIITNEDSTCVYSDVSCIYNFDDGIPFVTEAGNYGLTHFTDWPENNQNTYYIKCEDQYGKGPGTEACTIVVRPFDIPELQN